MHQKEHTTVSRFVFDSFKSFSKDFRVLEPNFVPHNGNENLVLFVSVIAVCHSVVSDSLQSRGL